MIDTVEMEPGSGGKGVIMCGVRIGAGRLPPEWIFFRG